jgi:hypothetical protein
MDKRIYLMGLILVYAGLTVVAFALKGLLVAS